MKNVNTEDIVKVVQDYTNYINGLCRRYYIVGGTHEDLFEEGMIGLLEACKSYNGESLFEPRFSPFAKLCIKRQIFDAIKSSNTGKNKALNESVSFAKLDSEGDERSLLETLSDPNFSNDPLDLVLDREIIDEKLKICENELSDFEKLVLEHYLAGEKQSEIAKNLKKDVKAIDNSIQRIKAKLNK